MKVHVKQFKLLLTPPPSIVDSVAVRLRELDTSCEIPNEYRGRQVDRNLRYMAQDQAEQ